MNDEIEHLKPTRHLATQAGCGHWAPIVPRSADVQDGAREMPVTPNPAKSAAPPGDKKQN